MGSEQAANAAGPQLPVLGAEGAAVIYYLERELARLRAEVQSQRRDPTKVSPEGKAILKFVRAKLDERIAQVRAENANAADPVVNVTVDLAPLAEIIGDAIQKMGEAVAVAMANRPKRSVNIEYSDGSISRIREA
jgi:hypothetical protein